MLTYWKPIDSLLRGDLAGRQKVSGNEISFPIWQVLGLSILLACIFGASIGSYTAVSAIDPSQGAQQLLASTVKAPLLFYLTLFVTFPSLYVFNALIGSQLNMAAAFRLLVASIAVMVAILASLGPIIVFFAFSTPSGNDGYRFIWILVVLTATMSGMLGLHYLLRMLKRHTEVDCHPSDSVGESELHSTESQVVIAESLGTGRSSLQPARPWQSKPSHGSPATTLFRVWVIVFAIVGAQMSWVLRPFIGSPNQEFSWFRERSGNFFQAVSHVVTDLLFGS